MQMSLTKLKYSSFRWVINFNFNLMFGEVL
jgi:hypothetical protein